MYDGLEIFSYVIQRLFKISSSFRGQKINYEDNRCYVVAVVCFRFLLDFSNWIPVFKIYQCYVPSINLLALLVHKKKIFKY